MTHDPDGAVCPISGAPMRRRFMIARDWRRPTAAESFEIWWSEAADFGQVLPRPAPEAIPAFYEAENYYTHSRRRTAKASRPGVFNRALLSLARRVDRSQLMDPQWWRSHLPASARSALDIGCGAGEQLKIIAAQLDVAAGVEPDPQARQAAAARGLTVYSGTAETLPPDVAGQQWDVVVMLHVLEHCLDPMRALRNAHALLRPGGMLIVETPNNACLGMRLSGVSWHWLDVPRHLNFFTPASLEAACRLAGFQVCATQYWGYTRQFNRTWIATEAKIEAILKGRTPAARPRLTGPMLRRALLLGRSAFAPPWLKYDSVRVICTRPPDRDAAADAPAQG